MLVFNHFVNRNENEEGKLYTCEANLFQTPMTL